MHIKTALLATVATLVAFPAFAQTNTGQVSADTSSQVEDVVVTARKRSEDVQTVPIAITAYTAADLEARNISNLNDLSNSTPGVAITSISGGNVLSIYLRGLAPANTSNDLNVDANVGTFIDGIYQTSRNTLDIISILDVGQIEIAKGPQSALYGRSTFAGALGITTRLPSKEQSSNFSVTGGTDEDFRLRASISMPIIPDVLAARISAGYLTYDGYGANSANPGDNLGGYEKMGASGALVFTPTDRFTATLTGFATRSRTEASPFYVLPNSAFNCGTTNALQAARTLYCGELQAQKVSSISPIPDNLTNVKQTALDLTYKADNFSVVSVTGFTRADNHSYSDYDGSANGLTFGVCTLGAACQTGANVPYARTVQVNLASSSIERVRTFSQELRIQSKDNARFQWLAGAYYFDSNIPLVAGGIAADRAGLQNNEFAVQILPGNPPGVGPYDFTVGGFSVADPNGVNAQRFASIARSSTESRSVFGSLGYGLTDALRVAVEARYNIDDKKARNFAAVGGNQLITGNFSAPGAQFNRSFRSFTPRFTIDYQATQNVFLYGSAAKGVRSGGFNTGSVVSTTGILAGEVAYDEESNWTYETGVKSRLFDRHLMLNASVFYVDWSNVQITSYTANPTAAASTATIIRNAGDLKTFGVEVQTDIKITNYASIGGSLTYSDPKFSAGAFDTSSAGRCGAVINTPPCNVQPFVQANGTTRFLPSLDGNRPVRAVKLSWNLNATFNAPVWDDWSLSGRVDINHMGDAYNNLINTASFGERTLTNVRLGVENDQYSAFVFANNLFDETYAVNSITQPRANNAGGQSVPEIYLGEGRRVGLTLSAKY